MRLNKSKLTSISNNVKSTTKEKKRARSKKDGKGMRESTLDPFKWKIKK